MEDAMRLTSPIDEVTLRRLLELGCRQLRHEASEAERRGEIDAGAFDARMHAIRRIEGIVDSDLTGVEAADKEVEAALAAIAEDQFIARHKVVAVLDEDVERVVEERPYLAEMLGGQPSGELCDAIAMEIARTSMLDDWFDDEDLAAAVEDVASDATWLGAHADAEAPGLESGRDGMGGLGKGPTRDDGTR